MSLADPENVWNLSMEERKELLHTTATNIAEQFVDINFHNDEDLDHTDKCNNYARRLLTLGCFYFEYSDAVRRRWKSFPMLQALHASDVEQFR